MKYSFVLPAYKATYLKDAIDSILSQTYSQFELIVVNDASPENLDDIALLYNDPRIRYYVNKENIGGKDLVAQWNHSIEYARGEYLILASDDDLYDKDYLAKMDELVNKYPNVNVFRPRVQYINEQGKIIGNEGYLKEYCTHLEFWQAWGNDWIGSGVPFYLFKRSKLDEIGGFAQYPLAWFSDDATILRLSESGVVSTNITLFSFRYSCQSITSKNNTYLDMLTKIKATSQFYVEIMSCLYADSANDKLSVYIKESLIQRVPRFISENKVIGQLYNTKWVTFTRLMPMLLRLKYVNKRRLISFYLWRSLHIL